VLRICIPVHNEATTVGVLLWRLRSVFQGFSREYDVVVYDDASTDGSSDVLEPYRAVMPLTILRGARHVGYAGSIDALVRHVAADDEYARRDAMILMQGDFTESPEHLPELVKRFEGGADLVAVHRTISDATPRDEKRLRRWGKLAIRPFLRMPPVADPFTGFRLVRIAALRDLLRSMGSRPVCAGDGWAANIDFALNVTPFARRIENVEFAPRYDVRQRPSRRRGWSDVIALFHWARSARNTVRPSASGRSAEVAPPRAERTVADAVHPALVVERSGGAGKRAERPERPARPERAERAERPERSERPERPERGAPRSERGARPQRDASERTETRPPREPKPPREAREPRPPRPPREPRVAVATSVADDVVIDEAALLAAPAALDGDVTAPIDDAAATPDEKRRRRRRRSRRGRGAKAGADELNGANGAAPGADSNDGDDDSDDGADDGTAEREPADGAVSATDGDHASASGRRKRPRRRKRGRRPGGPAADGGESAPSSDGSAASE
jgi:hypothetical protein